MCDVKSAFLMVQTTNHDVVLTHGLVSLESNEILAWINGYPDRWWWVITTHLTTIHSPSDLASSAAFWWRRLLFLVYDGACWTCTTSCVFFQAASTSTFPNRFSWTGWWQPYRSFSFPSCWISLFHGNYWLHTVVRSRAQSTGKCDHVTTARYCTKSNISLEHRVFLGAKDVENIRCSWVLPIEYSPGSF